MAESILMGSASGFIALDKSVTILLIWVRTDGGCRLTLSHLYNKYSLMIAAVHKFFVQQGLMEWMSPASFE
ncbi:MAG: hypothetical protein HYT41_00285 [Candidatus Sungbacteria bacterium]|nr:hypothetical protein [Candidatus Sungbacteria bacterium]